MPSRANAASASTSSAPRTPSSTSVSARLRSLRRIVWRVYQNVPPRVNNAPGKLLRSNGKSEALGTICAGTFLLRRPVRLKVRLSCLSWLLLLPGFALLGTANSLPVALAGTFAVGVANGSALILLTAAAQESIPDALLGRVMGTPLPGEPRSEAGRAAPDRTALRGLRHQHDVHRRRRGRRRHPSRPRPSAADHMTPTDAGAGSRTIGSPVIASIRSAACAAAAAGARRPVRTASSIT
jgi:hypothetical protein